MADERLSRLGRPLDRCAHSRPEDGRHRAAHGADRVNGLRLHLVANSHGHIDHIFDNGPLKHASGRAAGHPSRRRVPARRPQQLRLRCRGRAPDRDLREASGCASATSSSTSSTRRASARARSACARSAAAAPRRRRPVPAQAPTAGPISPATTSRWLPPRAPRSRDPTVVRVLPDTALRRRSERELPVAPARRRCGRPRQR